MNNDELTTSDVLTDETKNFSNIYQNHEDEEEHAPLLDSLYFTETDFNNLMTQCQTTSDNVTIISLNIANLLSKLNSLKIFLNYISTNHVSPDIIVVTETHILDINSIYTPQEIKNLLPNYKFFHKGRSVKKAGGVGIFVSKTLDREAFAYPDTHGKIEFIEESFENIVISIPQLIETGNGNTKKDLVIAAIYRQPNIDNFETFETELQKLLQTIDKRKNELCSCR